MLNRREILMGSAAVAASWLRAERVCAAAAYPLKATGGGRLLISAQVNGHDVEALLDSAAEASFVDRTVAQRIGLTAGASVTGKGSGAKNFQVPLVKGVTLRAAGLTLKDQTIAVSDLADVGRRLQIHPFDMILGRELFDAARLRIDITGRILKVLDSAAEPRGARFNLKTVNGVEAFPVRVEGTEALATLDIGNGSHVLVGSGFARRRAFLTDGRKVTSEMGGGLGGETVRKVFALKTLQIAGVTLNDVRSALDEGDSATDLNVGISVLQHFIITTDFRQHMLWLEPVRS